MKAASPASLVLYSVVGVTVSTVGRRVGSMICPWLPLPPTLPPHLPSLQRQRRVTRSLG